MKKVAIFGAYTKGAFYYEFIKKFNIYDVTCFIDNDIEKQKSPFYGLPVLSPKDAFTKKIFVILACKSPIACYCDNVTFILSSDFDKFICDYPYDELSYRKILQLANDINDPKIFDL